MKTTYIYGLYVTENNIRYVGKTNNLNKRLYEHVLNSKHKKTHKDIWIQKELRNGNEIKIILLEEVSCEKWQDAEIKYIEKYKNNKLTNHAKGGIGGRLEFYKISYDKAKIWVKENLVCKSGNEWDKLNKKNKIPNFVPKSPYEHYKNKGWISWGDFLGTNKSQDNLLALIYISYENAKKIIRNLNIRTQKEWKNLAQGNNIPKEIPNRPERYYKKRGWISWGDFLGTNRISNKNKKFISYKETILWLKNNNISLNSIEDWRHFYKNLKPQFIPSNPDKEYKNKGWESWGVFLGTNKISDNLKHKNYMSFDDAVNFARKLNIKSMREWKIWHLKNFPENIPLNPDLSYKKFWKGSSYFLGKSSKYYR